MKNFLTNYRESRKRGVTLIEGVLFLVLALSIIVGGIVFFQQASLSNRVNDTTRATVAIASEVRGMYSSQRDFGADADITPAVLNAGAVPSNFLNNDGTAIRHPWGGDILVIGDDQEFRIAITGLASEACVRMASFDANGVGTLGVGITGMEVGNVTGGDTAPTDPATTNGVALQASMTPAAAGAGCGNQVDDSFLVVSYARN